MAFTLIKEAATIAALGNKVSFVEHIRKVLGAPSLSAVVEQEDFQDDTDFQNGMNSDDNDDFTKVSSEDYHKWFDAIEAEAEEMGSDLNNEETFDEIAYGVLDDDPKMDSLSGGGDITEIKRSLVNSLRTQYQGTQAHKDVESGINNHISKTHGEERDVEGLVGADEGEEMSEFAQDFRSTHGIEDEEDDQPRFSTLKSLIGGKKKNPHEEGTLRHKIWADQHGDDVANQDLEGTDYSDEDLAYNRKDDEDFDDGDFNDHELNGDDFDEEGDFDSDKFPSNDEEHKLSYGDAGRGDDVDDYAPRSHSRRAISDQFSMADRSQDDMGSGDDIDDDGRLKDRTKTHDIDTEEQPDFDQDEVGYRHNEPDEGDQSDEEGDENYGPSYKNIAREEEEMQKQPVSFLHHVLTSPKENLTQAVKDIEGEGESAWKAHNLPQNPHPKKSMAFKAWERGMHKAAKEHFGFEKPATMSTSKKPGTRRR